jgi:hypothetical protein
MNSDLEEALKLVDLCELIAELYPDAYANTYSNKQRVKAVWRGGNSYNVILTAKKAHDFKTGNT